jgi:hypothetical protein
LKRNDRVECPYLLHSWLPELEKGFLQAQEGVLGSLAEEELEKFVVKLKLLLRGSWWSP